MWIALLGGALAALAPLTAIAQDGRDLATLNFSDVDQDGDGLATSEEGLAYSDLVFVSMDSNEDGRVDEPEFLSWGFGMSNLADEAGTRQSHDTALRMVFDLWDRDNDGVLASEEQSRGVAESYAYADADGDGGLSEAEFLQDFIINIGMRTALTATP